MKLPSVTVIVPCRNEAGYVEQFIDSLAAQRTHDFAAFEVIVADGESDDGTRHRLDAAAARFNWLRIISNPGLIVPTGLNAAIMKAKSEVVIRMDMHTEYAPDYLYQSVLSLVETKAANVGGPWRARGVGVVSRAIAAAFQSPIGCGGARGHDLDYEGKVDNCYLGCWYRTTLLQAGLFDEGLVRNQDDELNLRLIRSGGFVWQSPRIVSWYTPRKSLRSLFRQYCQYGFWKIPVIRKHRLPASLRHVVPAAFVLTCCTSPFAALAASVAGSYTLATLLAAGWAAMIAIYLLILAVESVRIATTQGRDLLTLLPAVFVTYHVAYGVGFLFGLFYWPARPLGVRPHSEMFSGLTR